jgi:hypothetical protein
MSRKISLFVIGSLVLAVLLVGVVVTPAVGQEEEEEPGWLAILAEQIRTGEIDVGDEYGMVREQRFHRIHADTIQMGCTQCHVADAPYDLMEPYSKSGQLKGPVDRRVCLGCHLTGPATKLYEPKE